MAKLTGQTLVALLEEAGYEPRSYSGRHMYGKKCVAVHTDRGATEWEIAWNLSNVLSDNEDDTRIPVPEKDQLGLGEILYWSTVSWPEETGNDYEQPKLPESGTHAFRKLWGEEKKL